MSFSPLYPLPKSTQKWGYDHIPDVYNKVDKQWRQITGDGSFISGLLRLLSGYKGNGKFSRGPDSWISLDTVSVGIAHWWADTIPDLFSRIATEKPLLTKWAWGEEAAEAMKDPKFLKGHLKAKRGAVPHNKKFDWLLSGWYEISRHPEVIEICVKDWIDSYIPPGQSVFKKYKWKLGTTLAGLVRLANSRGAKGMASLVKKGMSELGTDSETEVLPFVYKELYKKPERWEQITSWNQFKQPFKREKGSLLTPDQLDFVSPPIVRVDGSSPLFVKEGSLLTCS